MKGTALEVAEVFKEYSDERSDVYCGLLGGALLTQLVARSRISVSMGTCHIFSMIRIGEAYTNWLVDEKYVRLLIPRIRVESHIMDIIDPARTCIVVSYTVKADSRSRTKFHEQPGGRGTPWATIRPENDIILLRLASALEEVEE